MEWNALYVCGIFVRHVFVKAVLVLLSFSPNKTSGLGFIKETVAITKTLHYDRIYYYTAFSLATYPPTEHMGQHSP